MAQHWCNKNTLKQIPEMAEDIKKFDDTYQTWIDGGKEAGAQKRLAQDIAEWEKKRAEAKAKGEKEPRKPNPNQYKNPAWFFLLHGLPGYSIRCPPFQWY